MIDTATPILTVALDPLGLSVNDWSSIAKAATNEAIDKAHAAGFATVGASPDGQLYRTFPDGTVVEWHE